MQRTATFTPQEADFVAANRLHLASSFRTPRLLVRFALLWLFCVAVFAAIVAPFTPWREAQAAILVFSAFAAVGVFAVPFAITFCLGPYAVRRRFRQEKQLSDPIEVQWSEEAYEAVTPRITNRIPWSDYVRTAENDRLFMMFLSDATFQLLPKRVLSEAQIADIRTILRRSA
ncbi:YcxB family protein [Methylopila sp. M107]|uniref:YcxB family protein n=1 Tax=Methylopila sp. M107 TaxID=1101190 RepID=UPI00035FBCD2|nr:YcxB family protein [Methylopila sp. M107]